MEIHLSKPGGEREGPYTLEQINAGLAQKKYRDTDYWAWYEGLESWVPLHQIPGVVQSMETEMIVRAPELPASSSNLAAPEEDTQLIFSKAVASPKQPTAGGRSDSSLQSGMPIASLEHIFIFTDGEGPHAMRSHITGMILQEITGADLESIRKQASREVFGRCNIPQQLAAQQRVPDSAWRAVSALKPELAQHARDGRCRICIRSFEIESGQKVAAFLFYNK
jgi:hypothetical protein